MLSTNNYLIFSYFANSSDEDDGQPFASEGQAVSMETARHQIASYRSSVMKGGEGGGGGGEDEDDDDPLDAFMAGIEVC